MDSLDLTLANHPHKATYKLKKKLKKKSKEGIYYYYFFEQQKEFIIKYCVIAYCGPYCNFSYIIEKYVIS